MIAAAADNIARLLPHRRDYADLPRSWRRDILAGVSVVMRYELFLFEVLHRAVLTAGSNAVRIFCTARKILCLAAPVFTFNDAAISSTDRPS